MASRKLKNIYLHHHYAIAGLTENNHVLKNVLYLKDYYCGMRSIEECEIRMNEIVLNKLISDHTKLVIGGNLDNQLTSLSYALANRNLGYLGIYTACATFVEGIIIGANMASNEDIIVITSSHNLVSERQFKYPIEYGSPVKLSATFTTTGCVGAILNKEPSKLKVESYTIGNVIDYNIKDVSNMGAVMAPSAYETIKKHLKELKRDISYYDLVLTGDLGKYGLNILKDMFKEDNTNTDNLYDAGSMLYPNDQKKAGGSGPVCLPLILFNKILCKKKYRRILIVGTGSLHSKVLVDQKHSIPSISHAVSLEVLK